MSKRMSSAREDDGAPEDDGPPAELEDVGAPVAAKTEDEEGPLS